MPVELEYFADRRTSRPRTRKVSTICRLAAVRRWSESINNIITIVVGTGPFVYLLFFSFFSLSVFVFISTLFLINYAIRSIATKSTAKVTRRKLYLTGCNVAGRVTLLHCISDHSIMTVMQSHRTRALWLRERYKEHPEGFLGQVRTSDYGSPFLSGILKEGTHWKDHLDSILENLELSTGLELLSLPLRASREDSLANRTVSCIFNKCRFLNRRQNLLIQILKRLIRFWKLNEWIKSEFKLNVIYTITVLAEISSSVL